MDVLDFIRDWDKSHTSQPSYDDVIDWTKEKMLEIFREKLKTKFENLIAENVVEELVEDIINSVELKAKEYGK